ncbi:MAG: hypothetical protein ABII79_01845 [bacterium]
MSRILNPGALYFLDWCIQSSNPLQRQNDNAYTIEREGIEIKSKFDIKLIDSARRMYEEIWTVNVNDHGRHRTFETVERNKALMPDEFMNFLETREDFEFVGWWKDRDLGQPILSEDDINCPVALLRRTDSVDGG